MSGISERHWTDEDLEDIISRLLSSPKLPEVVKILQEYLEDQKTNLNPEQTESN